MNSKTTLVFGAGFSGRKYASKIVKAGGRVFGTTRSLAGSEKLRRLGITPLIFDGQATSPDVCQAIEEATDIIVSIAPNETGDPVMNCFSEAITSAPKLEWIGYLSTVGVYGNYDGAWVDELSPCRPVSARSKFRIAAEGNWREFADRMSKPLSIVRLSGIYGPGRNGLKNMVEGKARRLVKPGQVFNRIHVDDIAGSLNLLADQRANGVYNVTDDLPAPPQDVVEYAALVTKIDPPEEIDFETATLSPMARSFYGENKRVSNAKIKQAGYTFKYPDYRTAFDRMWSSGEWK